MAKMNEDPRHLEHKRKVDAERRRAAIARKRQQDLRDITPGVATPASLKAFADRNNWAKKAEGKS
jgi:hypothetical protein